MACHANARPEWPHVWCPAFCAQRGGSAGPSAHGFVQQVHPHAHCASPRWMWTGMLPWTPSQWPFHLMANSANLDGPKVEAIRI